MHFLEDIFVRGHQLAALLCDSGINQVLSFMVLIWARTVLPAGRFSRREGARAALALMLTENGGRLQLLNILFNIIVAACL